jgi:uncharacterized SAM-binding protein YcdF (DUF218 family)
VSLAAKYVLQHLLLPPGIFVAVLLLLSLRWAARRQWEPGFLSLFLAAALYSLSIGPVADRLITGLEERYAIPARPEGDSIVLLGGGVYGQAADLTGLGFPSEEMLPRVVTAARLQRRLGVPVVVSGGKVFDHLDAEAPVVARVLSDLGVPREKILVEAKSRDTVENARRTKEILAGNGLRRPLLVTSAYHMRRAVAVFEKAGVTVTPVPAGFRTWKGKPYPWVSYLPSAGALSTSTNALREYLGLLYCRIAC